MFGRLVGSPMMSEKRGGFQDPTIRPSKHRPVNLHSLVKSLPIQSADLTTRSPVYNRIEVGGAHSSTFGEDSKLMFGASRDKLLDICGQKPRYGRFGYI